MPGTPNLGTRSCSPPCAPRGSETRMLGAARPPAGHLPVPACLAGIQPGGRAEPRVSARLSGALAIRGSVRLQPSSPVWGSLLRERPLPRGPRGCASSPLTSGGHRGGTRARTGGSQDGAARPRARPPLTPGLSQGSGARAPARSSGRRRRTRRTRRWPTPRRRRRRS